MEKLLDRPRAFEESHTRYVLALEAQKRAQILLISNAQRKLVLNFQQKLKASQGICQTHRKWVLDAKAAQQNTERGIERSGTNAANGKTRITHRKTRPKTTGANKSAGWYLSSTLNSFEDISRYNKPMDYLKPKGTVVEAMKGKALQGDEFGGKTPSVRTPNANDPRCYSRDGSNDSCSPALHHLHLHSSPTMPQRCTEPVSDTAKRIPDEGNTSSFCTGNLDYRNIHSQVYNDGSNRYDHEKQDMHLSECLPMIGCERAKGSVNTVKICEARKRVIRKSRSFDVNKLDNNGLSNANNYVALEMHNSVLQNSNYSRMDDSGCVDDGIRTRPVVDTLSCNESTSKKSMRSRGTKYHSNGLASDRSSNGSALTERKIPYELRTWMSNIKSDVEKIHSCIEDPPSETSPRVLTHKNSWKSEISSASNHSLEKFDDIFRGLSVKEALFDENSENQNREELVDASCLYSTAACMDSKLDSDQTWHKRDPRNKKLKPSIFL